MRCFVELPIIALLLTGTAYAEVTNRVVARVNDRILTLYDYETSYERALLAVSEMPSNETERDEALRQVARSVMRNLWDELLILSRADQKGWTVPESEVRAAIENMMEANGIRTDRELAEGLAREGLTLEKWKQQIERQLIYRQVVGREVYAGIEIGEEDLRRYYRSHPEEFAVPEHVQVQEVVVLQRADETAMLTMAHRILEQLRTGTPIEEVSSEYDSQELSGLIDLGWVAVEDLDPKVATVLAGLQVGEFSEPTAARGGLHIARVLGRREATTKLFNEIEPELRRQEEDKRLEEGLVEYLIELEKKAYLTLDPPAAAIGFRTSTGETPLEVDFPLLDSIRESSEASGGNAE